MNLVLQVQIADDKRSVPRPQFYDAQLYAESAESAEAYANTTGAAYMLVTDDRFRPGFHATYQSLGALDLQDFDRILFLDSDVIVRPGCPNIFEAETLGLSATASFDPAVPYHSMWARRKMRHIGLARRPVFCAGVMMMTREWRAKIAPIVARNFDFYYRRKRFDDEEMLNAALGEDPFTVLPPDWGCWYQTGAFMDHFSTHRRDSYLPRP